MYNFPKRGDLYKVNYSPGYGKGAFRICLNFGSDVTNPRGTHSVCLKNGDVIEFESIAMDGSTWFLYKGERGKHIGNGWSNMLKDNLELIG